MGLLPFSSALQTLCKAVALHLLLNVVYFRCSVLISFSIFQIASTSVGCKCRHQIWVTFKRRWKHMIKIISDTANKSEVGTMSCSVNPASVSVMLVPSYLTAHLVVLGPFVFYFLVIKQRRRRRKRFMRSPSESSFHLYLLAEG